MYLLFIAPAFLLAMWAQWRVQSNFQSMSRVRASMTGFQAARRILDSHGLRDVRIEQVAGRLSDHYDPGTKVVRLSQHVYGTPSMAAVGIAAHEVGHALQDAKNYSPLVIRNLAVPLASFGGSIGGLIAMAGLGMLFAGMAAFGKGVLLVGIVLFGFVVFFQLINLPVEFDASARAKNELVGLGIVSTNEIHYVSKVLNAAAMTYVAATLQTVLTLAYYITRYMSASRN
jgi:Zn-dependent membrane protease YugP